MVNPEFVITVVGTGMGILIGMGAITITLFIQSQNCIKSVEKEMKDFHSRLEKQDADFKSFLKEQELRRTKILLREE